MPNPNEIGSHTFDNLISGCVEVTDPATLVSGAGNLKRGSVLGKITASGKLTLVNSAGTDDGRRTPYAVLLEDTDATSADKAAPVALAGVFNGAALIFGGSDTLATHRAALRDVGIFTQAHVAAVNP